MINIIRKKVFYFCTNRYLSELVSIVQGELLNAPCTSPIQSLITTYFNNTIAQKCSVMTDTHKKMEKTLKAANNFLK